jgi:hypothetical protein
MPDMAEVHQIEYTMAQHNALPMRTSGCHSISQLFERFYLVTSLLKEVRTGDGDSGTHES